MASCQMGECSGEVLQVVMDAVVAVPNDTTGLKGTALASGASKAELAENVKVFWVEGEAEGLFLYDPFSVGDDCPCDTAVSKTDDGKHPPTRASPQGNSSCVLDEAPDAAMWRRPRLRWWDCCLRDCCSCAADMAAVADASAADDSGTCSWYDLAETVDPMDEICFGC